MWNVGGGGGSKRPKAAKKAKIEHPVRLRRVPGQVKLGSDILPAQIVLNDLSATHMIFYTSQALAVGDKVNVTFDHPKRFYGTGHVLWSEEVRGTHRIMGEVKYHFRARIEFTFENEEQAKGVAEFAADLHDRVLNRNGKSDSGQGSGGNPQAA